MIQIVYLIIRFVIQSWIALILQMKWIAILEYQNQILVQICLNVLIKKNVYIIFRRKESCRILLWGFRVRVAAVRRFVPLHLQVGEE